MHDIDEAKEIEILRGLVKAMQAGKIESLTYKRSRRGGKQFECAVSSPLSCVNHSATSIEGKHDLGYLFLDTVRRSIRP